MKRLKSLMRPLVKSVSSQPVRKALFLPTTQSAVFPHKLIVNQLRQYSSIDKKKSWIEEEQEKNRTAQEFASFKAQYNGKRDKPETEEETPKEQVDKEVEAARNQYYQFILKNLRRIPKEHRGYIIFLCLIGSSFGLGGLIGLINWLKNEIAEQSTQEANHFENWGKYQHVMQPVDYYLPSHWVNELEERLKLLKTSTKEGTPLCLAITGMPGSGKSELANFFAMRYLDSLQTLKGLHKSGLSNMPIVWTLNAESLESLQRSYQDLASKLGVPTMRASQENEEDYQARLQREVNQALQAKPGWLLLFDNAESYKTIKAYIPYNGHQQGTVLATSRQVDFFHNTNHNVNISQGLKGKEAIELLNKLSGINDAQQGSVLANEVEYLPHYLAIAAFTIKKHNEDHPQYPWSYQDYAKQLQKLSLKDQIKQQTAITQKLPYNHTQYAIIELALNKLKDAKARELLFVCSLLQADGIPRYLLQHYVQQIQPELDSNAADIELDNLIDAIQRTGVLQYQPQQETYRIHRITQQIAKNNLDAVTLSKIIERLSQSLVGSFPQGDWYLPENRDCLRELLVHYRSFIQQKNVLLPESLLTSKLLAKIGRAYLVLGQAQQAQQALATALPIQIACYGKNHPKIAITLGNLANAYLNLGNSQQAKTLYQQALSIQEAYYGKNHPIITIILNNLSITYLNLGDSRRAKALCERSLAIGEAHYGKDHQQVAGTIINLASTYLSLGNSKQAKALLERALPIQTAYYGKNHPIVAITLSNLASVYRSLGDHRQAKPLLEQALSIQETHYGKNHPKVTVTLNNLANTYRNLGDHREAKLLLEQAFLVQEAYYGNDHQNMAIILNNLASVYRSLGDNEQTNALLERALLINETYYGKNHPEVAVTLNNLAGNYLDLGDSKQAKALLEQALLIEEVYYGKDHPKIAITLSNLASAYYSLGDSKQAKDLLERALPIEEAHYGKDHPDVAITLGDLANYHLDLGNSQQARIFLERALPIFEKHYSKNNQDVKIMQRLLQQLKQEELTKKEASVQERFFQAAKKAPMVSIEKSIPGDKTPKPR